jgi:predicted PurR-regulated permease PerM
MTIAYALAFLAILSGFLQALLLAAVFSGIVYPLYLWIKRILGDRDTLASLLTITLTLFVIVVPLIIMLGLIAEQAVNVAGDVTPWIEMHLDSHAEQGTSLPDWVPFADKLAPYKDTIPAKISEFTGTAGRFLAESLAWLSHGTISFFFQLFVMLYAMFFFLTDGPAMLNTILSYAPMSRDDKDKMLAVGLSVSRATVKGTLIIGLIQGTLGGIGFAVAGVKAALFWGAIMTILSVLPGIGTALIWGPAVIYLLISGEVAAGLGLLAWSALVVGSIDNVLRPVLVGRDTKMPDLLILLSTLGGLSLFGASGLVLGPILAALFLTVLAIYSRVFADWLNVDQSSDDMQPGNTPEVRDNVSISNKFKTKNKG